MHRYHIHHQQIQREEKKKKGIYLTYSFEGECIIDPFISGNLLIYIVSPEKLSIINTALLRMSTAHQRVVVVVNHQGKQTYPLENHRYRILISNVYNKTSYMSWRKKCHSMS